MDSFVSSLPAPPPPTPASRDTCKRSTDFLLEPKEIMSILNRDNYRTPPSHANRHFTNSSYSSDEASEDGDDVPPTPGDLGNYRSIALVPYTDGGHSRGGVELRKLFAQGVGENSATIQADGSLSLSPVANVFYPSFGDFLPAVKRQEEALKTNGLGLCDWDGPVEAQTTSDKIDSLSRSLTGQLDISNVSYSGTTTDSAQVASPLTGTAASSSVFAPFATFSPNTDSFTFFPSPDWKANDRGRDSKEGTATSASLRSPEPDAGPAAFPMQKSFSGSNGESHRSHVIVTPPSTPIRNPTYRTAPPMQQSRSLPVPVAMSPLRCAFAPTPSPTRTTFSQPQAQYEGYSQPTSSYPLSPIDTERIAKLHNGRIPTLEQLCPEPVHPSAQPPIVNTGNQGVMVVQQGDWSCGTCSFVNWRRRKICLRCFPFANDIGNILTIQSQRAAHLATPLSAPAHQTNFFIQSPTRGHFDVGMSAAGMSRSATHPPSNHAARSYGSRSPGYLLVPPPPMPHSASPTRSTFALQPPPSPTRSMSSYASSSPRSLSPYHQLSSEESFYSTSNTSPSSASSKMSSLGAISSGDLALRRAAKLQLQPQSSVRKNPSIQPLNLSNYSQQMQYAQSQSSPTYDRSPSYYQSQRSGGESPVSPTRYFHQQHQAQQRAMLGAEL
ncbi:hypothetical protein JCM16303_002806 [Sporobolomyces ruberrimus]